MRKLLILASLLVFAAPAAVLAQNDLPSWKVTQTLEDLPPGPGADVVARVCSECHDDGVYDFFFTCFDATGWGNILDQMVRFGATIKPDEREQIISYLAMTFPAPGTKNINTAPAPSGEINRCIPRQQTRR